MSHMTEFAIQLSSVSQFCRMALMGHRTIRQNCEIAKVESRIQSCVTSRVKYITGILRQLCASLSVISVMRMPIAASRRLTCIYLRHLRYSHLKIMAEQTNIGMLVSYLVKLGIAIYSIQVAQVLMFLNHLDVKPGRQVILHAITM